MDLEQAVAALPLGWRARYFASVGSTQDEARTAARAGAPSRSLFVADVQTAGSGRQSRAWLAPPGTALLLSVLWRESVRTPRPWRWTALASLALVGAIEHTAPGLEPSIKWPNDVLLDGRKVAGVLAESSWDGEQLLVIVGVGINVSSSAPDLSAIDANATSLALSFGHVVDRGQLLHAFVDVLDRLAALPHEEVMARWQQHLWGRGQRLRLLDVGAEEEVVVLGAELDGSLRVRLADGSERLTTTGELIL
jgi:BirA family biotin operon repressor/biotin-[acetyl-CoA-carboxylase] ligase